MGKLKVRSGIPAPEKQEVVVPKTIMAPKINDVTNDMLVGNVTFAPMEETLPSSCVCPVEMAAVNLRLDSVMKSIEKLETKPDSNNTKLDAYIKSNNESLKSMSDTVYKIKTQASMVKNEVKVVEKVVECKHQDQTEKRQEIGLELDRLQQGHIKRMREMTSRVDYMEMENHRLLKTVKVMKLTAAVCVLMTIINIFI